MAQTIKLKRSGTSGAVPTTSQLELGEVAINTYDGKMYIKKSVSGTESIVEIGSGSDGIFEEYIYTATNAQTAFSGSDDNSLTLAYTSGAIQVFLNGVLLDPDTDYTATNGTTVTLASAAATSDLVQIFAFKKKISDGSVTVDTFSGNNSTTAFTLSLDPGDENNTRVFIDGVYQSKSNYSVSGTTLTFSSAPPTGTAIEVEIGNRNVTLDTTANLDLPDDVKLRLGTSQDLEIYHNGSHSYIDDAGTGNLYIRNGTKNSIFARTDGEVILYHNDSNKLATTSSGATITGTLVADGVSIGDNEYIYVGASNDLQIYHNANDSIIRDAGTGRLLIGASELLVTNSGLSEAQLQSVENGAVTLYYDGSSKLATTSTGVSVTGNIVTDGEIRGPATFVIDPAAVGDNTGTVQIKGNLQVDGSTTTINSTTLTVDDLNITLASGATTASSADGAGITIDGASATLTYGSSNDNWEFNKELRLTTGLFAAYVNTGRYLKYRSSYSTTAVADFEINSDNNSLAVARITGTGTADIFQVYDGTTEVFTILDGGNVGIGTTAPATKLDVAANGTSQGIRLNISGVGRLQMYADGDRNYFKGLSGNGHRFTTTGGANVEILNSGNVGIGTTSPGSILDIVDGTSDSDPAILRLRSGTEANTGQGDVYAGIEFGVVGAENSTGALTNGVNAAIKSIDTRSGETSFEDAGLGFYTTDSADSAPVLRAVVTDDGGLHVTNDGNIDTVSAGQIKADGNIYGNQLYSGGTRIANSSGYLTATVIVADDVDFLVSDSTDATTNIIWRDHSASKLYLGTSAAQVEFRSDITVGSGLQAFFDGGAAAANPAITFGTDTDTGIIRPTTNTLGFVTGGTERARINASGNVGIGTSSPSGISGARILEVKNTSTGTGTHAQITLTGSNGHTNLLLASGDDTTGGDPVISSTTNHAIRFGHSTNSTFSGFDEHMRIDDGGRVGIGVTPSSSDHRDDVILQFPSNYAIGGTYSSFGETASGQATIIGNNIRAEVGANNQVVRHISSGDAGNFLKLVYNQGFTIHTGITSTLGTGVDHTINERVRVDTSGNVGIGTSSPGEKLHVEGSVLIDAFNAGDEEGIFFREGFSSTNKYNVSIMAKDHNGSSADGLSINGYDGVSFCTGSNTRNEVMRIVGGSGSDVGYVGIGTTSPQAKLHVDEGPVYIGDYSGAVSPTEGIFLENTAGNSNTITMYTYNASVFKIESDGIEANIGWASSADREVNFLNTGAGDLKVGIGTDSPAQLLHVNGITRSTSIILGDSATGNVPTNSQLHIKTGGTPRIMLEDSTGSNLAIGIDAEQGTGFTIRDYGTNPNNTPTTRLRIDTSGRIRTYDSERNGENFGTGGARALYSATNSNYGKYEVILAAQFTAGQGKYIRIQQDGNIQAGLRIHANGDYSNVDANGSFEKGYTLAANSVSTSLFGGGTASSTITDLGSTSSKLSMGTITKPNNTTIYIPVENLDNNYSITFIFSITIMGQILGITSIDIINQ